MCNVYDKEKQLTNYQVTRIPLSGTIPIPLPPLGPKNNIRFPVDVLLFLQGVNAAVWFCNDVERLPCAVSYCFHLLAANFCDEVNHFFNSCLNPFSVTPREICYYHVRMKEIKLEAPPVATSNL